MIQNYEEDYRPLDRDSNPVEGNQIRTGRLLSMMQE